MKNKISLVIMAAGIGSRYGGGIKQLAAAGPSGEILMDYSIYDALKAGFEKIVFVIRHDIEKDFREIIGAKIECVCETEYVFQEIEDLPEGFSKTVGRTKPWGTGHAILACRNAVKEPFAVINADDFYGRESFTNIYRYLSEDIHKEGLENIFLSGYILKNTLSENGGVTRGICKMGDDGFLQSINETKNIRREGGRICADGIDSISEDTFVSMNMWGLYPSFIDKLGKGFVDFLSGLSDSDIKSEFLLPDIIDGLIKKKEACVKLIPTHDKWFGITYKEDMGLVRSSIEQLVKKGEYPVNVMAELIKYK